jgi:hypothetical protein
MPSSQSSEKKIRWRWWTEFLVECVVGIVFGVLVVDWAYKNIGAVYLGIFVAALIIVQLRFYWDTRHLALYDLGNRPRPSIRGLFRSRKPVGRAQASLRRLFDALEQCLLEVVSAGRTENSSYRDQMDLAYLFYGVHTKRFWATSFDRWSTFLLRNELYMRQMAAPCTHGSATPTVTAKDPGLHARLFILPLRAFIDDVVRDPTAARILVRHHLWAWQRPMRILLHTAHSYTESSQRFFGALDNLGAPVIPDFMIVDDLFVYGRVAPERVDAETMEPPKLEPTKLALGYSADSSVVKAYVDLFTALWNDALDVLDYCSSLRECRASANSPPASSRAIAAAASTLDMLTQYQPADQEQLFATIRNIEGDLVDFFNELERGRRYPEIHPVGGGKDLERQILLYVKHTRDEIWAIDQVDIKRSDRFWVTWKIDPGYKPFREATEQSTARTKQRIFIIKTWDGLDSFPALSFVNEQLQANISLGFILQADVDRIATLVSNRDNANGDSDPSKSSIDSDFVIMDFDRADHGCTAGDRTRGFETAYKQYVPDEIRYQSSLPCKARIDRLLTWYIDLRDSGSTLFVFPDNPDIEAFKRALAMKTTSAKTVLS